MSIPSIYNNSADHSTQAILGRSITNLPTEIMLNIAYHFLHTVVHAYARPRSYAAVNLDIEAFLEVFPEMDEPMLDFMDSAMISCIHGTQHYKRLVSSVATYDAPPSEGVKKMWKEEWASTWDQYGLLNHLHKTLESRILEGPR